MSLKTSLFLFFVLIVGISVLTVAGVAEIQKSQLIQPKLTTITIPPASELFLVSRVIDGDTFELQGGQKVRMIGIDTPETVDTREKVQCFGLEASTKTKELLENKQVRLEKDISETDRYGRLLRYVWVGDTFVNDYLISLGYAKSSSYPPDVKYQYLFNQTETTARTYGVGLWGPACTSPQNPL